MCRYGRIQGRIRRLLFLLAVTASIESAELIGRAVDASAQATLDPGQLSGPVRIGTRDILGGVFQAYATAGATGFNSLVGLNGTTWNGTDFTGPLDPFGYTLTVQALDPDTGDNVPYAVVAGDVKTSSGVGDADYTRFPSTADVMVNPDEIALAAFDEPNPWILDAEIVNIGPCPNTHFAYFKVEANAHINTRDWAGGRSEDSQGEIDGAGLTVRRYLDMPLLPGPGGSNVYDVTATAHIGTSGNPNDPAPIVMYAYATVGQSDVVVDGMGVPHIHVVFQLDFDCQCPLSSISGTLALNGITPADQFNGHTVIADGPSYQYAEVSSNPTPYTIAANMQPGHYGMRAFSYFGDSNDGASLLWPYSTHRDYEGFYYEDVDCNQNGTYSFEANAAVIEGKISYTCQAEFEPALVQTYDIFSDGMFEGLNPDGSHIGSYGGQAGNARNFDDGHYRMVASEGSWTTHFHRHTLRSTNYSCCGANPTTADYVYENLHITETQYIAATPSDPAAIHLGAGDVFHRDFSYEMAKVTIYFTINGNTPAETLLKDPILSMNGTATDPGTGDLLYYTSVSAQGTGDEVQVGSVTAYLPKGEYLITPYATRVFDGSRVSFPNLPVSIGGCVDVSCTVSCPSVDWTPRADTCGNELGEVAGTASDPDGWSHISYRVNHLPPGGGTTDGYIPFALIPTGGPNNEVSFTAPLTLQLGANDVEVEAVDSNGNRYYEHRTAYRTTGAPPVLTWTDPVDASTTDQSTTLVQGTVSASVKIDSVTVNGVSVTLSPDPGSSDPNARLFTYTLPLALGANEIIVQVIDVCGADADETRSVTRVLPQPTATPTATFTPLVTASPPPTETVTPTPTTTPTPTAGDLDHFQCYETHRRNLAHDPLSLIDAFGPSTARVKRAKRICAPADKNGEDPTAPAHLEYQTAYTIKQTSAFQRVRDLDVTNQFGTVTLDVVKPDRLLVPTALSAVGPPVPLAAPAEHFKCYRVTGARAPGAHVQVATAFGAGVVDVKKPLHLCVPVDKNGEGIVDPAAHLLCYRARTPSVPNVSGAVSTLNQFGPDTFAVFGARELCVPSTVQP